MRGIAVAAAVGAVIMVSGCAAPADSAAPAPLPALPAAQVPADRGPGSAGLPGAPSAAQPTPSATVLLDDSEVRYLTQTDLVAARDAFVAQYPEPTDEWVEPWTRAERTLQPSALVDSRAWWQPLPAHWQKLADQGQVSVDDLTVIYTLLVNAHSSSASGTGTLRQSVVAFTTQQGTRDVVDDPSLVRGLSVCVAADDCGRATSVEVVSSGPAVSYPPTSTRRVVLRFTGAKGDDTVAFEVSDVGPLLLVSQVSRP